ncbi:hypothetical protein JRQ81_013728 [Phrynocephalus forsythii]|uniref:Ferritin n=1 Tax=Phrynocephalus forsythii TaxID=171643 RepID=A0A9Q0Y0S1_9SAUR|nr:hypothetical protein JRQ81_013728 [Phrynocephalus forsythii]
MAEGGSGSAQCMVLDSGMDSQVRQNFHVNCEAAVNRLVNLKLHTSYVFLSMSYHFDHDDIALSHVDKFLKEKSKEKTEHAEKFDVCSVLQISFKYAELAMDEKQMLLLHGIALDILGQNV